MRVPDRIGPARHSVTPIERVKALAQILDVLPRHRLLLKPGGFEGFPVAQEIIGAKDLPGSEGEELPELLEAPMPDVRLRTSR